MKTLAELYLACGGHQDGRGVHIPELLQPIEIKLKVIPSEIHFDREGDKVTFDVLIPDKLVVEYNAVSNVSYDEQIRLPIEAVEIIDG